MADAQIFQIIQAGRVFAVVVQCGVIGREAHELAAPRPVLRRCASSAEKSATCTSHTLRAWAGMSGRRVLLPALRRGLWQGPPPCRGCRWPRRCGRRGPRPHARGHPGSRCAVDVVRRRAGCPAARWPTPRRPPRRISCTPSSFAPGSASVPVAYRQTTTPQAVGAHSLKSGLLPPLDLRRGRCRGNRAARQA